MRVKKVLASGIVVVSFIAAVCAALAAQDKWTVKALNGVGFSEFKGYEDWRDVAVSQTEQGVKAILANPVMIDAYRAGIPGNRKPFPEGSMVVKIEWTRKQNDKSPYPGFVPENLKSVSFIEKDSKRFPDTSGWGYAQFLYDPKAKKFTAFGDDASFGKTVCYKCHTSVKDLDYIFTAYPLR